MARQIVVERRADEAGQNRWTSHSMPSSHPALADLARAAKDEHEREEQDEQARAFEVIGDHLTAGGFEAWQRDQDVDQGQHEG